MTALNELRALSGLSESACEIAQQDIGWTYADIVTWYKHLGRFPYHLEVDGIAFNILGGKTDIEALAKAMLDLETRFPPEKPKQR